MKRGSEALGVLFAEDDRARQQGAVLWTVQDGLIFLKGPEVLLKVVQLFLAQGQVLEVYFFFFFFLKFISFKAPL